MAGKYGTYGVGVDLPGATLERLQNPGSVLADVLHELFSTVGKAGVFGEAADERKARLQGEVRQSGKAEKAPAEQWEVTEDGMGVRRVTPAAAPNQSDPRSEVLDDLRRRQAEVDPSGYG